MAKRLIEVYPKTKEIIEEYEILTNHSPGYLLQLMIEHFLFAVNSLDEQTRDEKIEESYAYKMEGTPSYLFVDIDQGQIDRVKAFFSYYGVCERKGLDIVIRYAAIFVYMKYLEP